jgi:vacuolar-type H+-ATPase subunit C/Vma6
MIRHAIRYAYPIAQSRALIGNLLRPKDYAQLLHVDKADDFLAYLRATAYASVIAATREKPAADFSARGCSWWCSFPSRCLPRRPLLAQA